ncbi:lytic transglycosylase domain-containing protein [Miniphocaeibacter massiliensis]|uniref:lytic transglycosylase domain-containing protein n=1 Tax=Miniphocaeibacter massiliensis TaxID=2041841 RepID=UPI000C1BA385|nr:lytic transglycosylase domain-containing protein [Miniphocaeibacter massiliensis]
MKIVKRFLIFILVLFILGILTSFAIVSYGTVTRPVEYTNYVNKYSEEYDVDPLLIMSVIKVESNFKEDVKSHMNAVGLMQIIPDTGKWVAEKIDVDYSDDILKDPETNIKLGTYYLSYLISHFQDNDLAIAAYNGGMGNVDNWIKDGIVGKNGVGLENIPIKEAKNYVVKVDEQYEVYTRYYKGETLEDGMEKSPLRWFKNYFKQIKSFIYEF